MKIVIEVVCFLNLPSLGDVEDSTILEIGVQRSGIIINLLGKSVVIGGLGQNESSTSGSIASIRVAAANQVSTVDELQHLDKLIRRGLAVQKGHIVTAGAAGNQSDIRTFMGFGL